MRSKLYIPQCIVPAGFNPQPHRTTGTCPFATRCDVTMPMRTVRGAGHLDTAAHPLTASHLHQVVWWQHSRAQTQPALWTAAPCSTLVLPLSGGGQVVHKVGQGVETTDLVAPCVPSHGGLVVPDVNDIPLLGVPPARQLPCCTAPAAAAAA